MERIRKVTGTGRMAVTPDQIQVDINAEGKSADYGETVSRSAADTGVLREAVQAAGLDPKDLKTTYFNVDTDFDRYQDETGGWRDHFIGYVYRHGLSITIPRDNDILGRLLYQLANCSVKTEFSFRHTVSDPKAAKNELLARAIADSKEKAEIIALNAGLTLGEIQSVDYSWQQMQIYSQPITMYGAGMTEKRLANIDSMDIDIEAADINIEDTVTIVWAVE